MIYQHTFRVRLPTADVIDFYFQSTSLKAITPPLIPMVFHHAPDYIVDGDEIDFTMWVGPLPVRWIARVDEISPTSFLDRQVCGPFDQWVHRHIFVAVDDNATEVVDEITVQMRKHLLWGPVGLGIWLGLPFLFAYRGWKTRHLLEGKSL